MVDRIIVVVNQKIILDGPRDVVLQQLNTNQDDNQQQASAQGVAATQPPQSGPAAPNAGEGSEQSGGDGNAA
ncbi:hypothetical protein N9F31_01505 [Pseudomonadales bacterium]|nr:hypothetical protein [Pseudomonadales bacterium]